MKFSASIKLCYIDFVIGKHESTLADCRDTAVSVVLLATSPLMNMHNLKSALACAASSYHHTAHLTRRHAT